MDNPTTGDNLISAETDSSQHQTSQQTRILLAEDDAAMRRLLEVLLNRAGYEVVCAEDGLQAMQAAGTSHFDLAIIDAIMPNLSGVELCRILRSNPNWQKMRLIMMSGMESDAVTEVDAHVLKSSRLQEELLEKVSTLLAARS